MKSIVYTAAVYRRNIIKVYIFVHCSRFIWFSVDLAEKRTGNSDLVKNIVYAAAVYRRNIIRVYIFVHCSRFTWFSVDLAEKRTGNSDLMKNYVYTAAAYKAAEREWLDDGYEFVTHWDVRTIGVLFRNHHAHGVGKSGRNSSQATLVLFARVYETAQEASRQNRESVASTGEGVDEYDFLTKTPKNLRKSPKKIRS